MGVSVKLQHQKCIKLRYWASNFKILGIEYGWMMIWGIDGIASKIFFKNKYIYKITY